MSETLSVIVHKTIETNPLSVSSEIVASVSVPSSPSWAHGGMETDATISDETDKRIGLNSFVYYFSMTYTSIIATESIVTI